MAHTLQQRAVAADTMRHAGALVHHHLQLSLSLWSHVVEWLQESYNAITPVGIHLRARSTTGLSRSSAHLGNRSHGLPTLCATVPKHTNTYAPFLEERAPSGRASPAHTIHIQQRMYWTWGGIKRPLECTRITQRHHCKNLGNPKQYALHLAL